MIEARRVRAKPQVDISFPEIEKFDHLPPARVEGASAFVSIMEGCSKYCSYCVVPYTRGEEVSRPLDDVLLEVAGLAEQGVKEVTLLGQNVNAWRGPMGDTAEVADFALLLEYVAEIPGIERIRYTTSHPNEPPAPPGAARQRPHPQRHEARLHRAAVQEHHPRAAARAPGHQPVE
jgi:tRNA-2-methylthio-N6-dimethylallyladenosine synthase